MAKAKPTKTKKSEEKPGDLLAGILEDLGDEDGAQLLGGDGMAIKIKGVISTQVPGIDDAIGRGGIPLGRLTIIHGAEGSGKTTLALHLVAECQRQKGVVIYIDKEYKLDPDYAKAIGCDTSNLLIVQPPHLEKTFATIEKVIARGKKWRETTGVRVPILIVLDSMNAAITKAELEGAWDDQHMARQARVYSASLPKLMPKVFSEDVALVFISQVRQKIGVMFGDGATTSGGKSPKFYASLMIKVDRIGTEKTGEKKTGSKVKIECVKNQIAPPFKTVTEQIDWGIGFSRERSLIETAVNHGIMEKSGNTYSHNGDKVGVGIKNAVKTFQKDPEWMEEIYHSFRGKRGWE
jgi:recombination protein RecA